MCLPWVMKPDFETPAGTVPPGFLFPGISLSRARPASHFLLRFIPLIRQLSQLPAPIPCLPPTFLLTASASPSRRAAASPPTPSTCSRACGIKIKSPKEKLLLHADNFPLDLLFVRDDDIPQLVMDGVCDLGIVGQNVLEESALERARQRHGRLRRRARARLRRLPPRHRHSRGPRLQRAQRSRRPAHRHYLPAAHQPLPRRARRQGRRRHAERLRRDRPAPSASPSIICDLVSSGSTLEANKLRAVETIFKSTAMLHPQCPRAQRRKGPLPRHHSCAASTACRRPPARNTSCSTPRRRTLADIRKLLPGSENPTILPLAGDDIQGRPPRASARKTFSGKPWTPLKKAGASNILVLPIEEDDALNYLAALYARASAKSFSLEIPLRRPPARRAQRPAPEGRSAPPERSRGFLPLVGAAAMSRVAPAHGKIRRRGPDTRCA